MKYVAVIDYGMGNLRSVSKAIECVATNNVIVKVTSDPAYILTASHVILPGVGAMRDCIGELQRLELDHMVYNSIEQKPFLGICLGMQALLTYSEENGGIDGLDIIPGNVYHFNTPKHANPESLKVPHMGWNKVNQTLLHPLWNKIKQNSHFYFAHSYFINPSQTCITAATTNYLDNFTSAISKNNIFAVQFHPEKSQYVGLQLLENFLSWDGQS